MRRQLFLLLLCSLVLVAWVPRRGGRGGNPTQIRLLIDPTRVLVAIIDGQSNARGWGGVPSVSTSTSTIDYVLCADDARLAHYSEASLVCLKRVNGVGEWGYTTETMTQPYETPLSGFMDSIRGALPNHAPSIIGLRCGYSGAAIVNWDPDKTTEPKLYEDCIHRVQIVANMVAASPATYGGSQIQVIGTARWQGEADSILNTAEATYQAALEEFADRWAIDVLAITGQPKPPVLVVEVPTSWGSDNPPKSEPPPAYFGQVAACDANPLIYCQGPNYPYDGHDTYHKMENGHRLAGEVMGRALMQAVLSNNVKPLRVSSAITSGTALTVCFDVPNPPLQLDESTTSYAIGQGTSSFYGCPSHPDGQLGLEVYDTSGSPPTLSNIQLAGDTAGKCVTAELSRALVPAESPEVRVAWTGNETGSPLTRFSCIDSTDVGFANFTDSTSPVPVWAMPSSVSATQVADAGVAPDSGVPVQQYAIRFGDDAVNEYLSAADEATWTIPGPVTVCSHLWLNNATAASRNIASWGTFSSNWSWSLETTSCTGGACGLRFWVATATPDGGSNCRADITYTTGLPTDAWHTVCVVGDPSTDVYTFYVDGVASVGTNTGACAASTFIDSTGSMQVGAWPTLGRYFTGYVRTLSVWHEELTSGEIGCVHSTAPTGSVIGCASTTPVVDITGSVSHTAATVTNAGTGGDFASTNGEDADFCILYPDRTAGTCP